MIIYTECTVGAVYTIQKKDTVDYDFIEKCTYIHNGGNGIRKRLYSV